MNDINTAENPGDATWLWYPGDYEIWLHALVSLRRERNGAIEPPFWRLDTSHPKVLFRTKIKGPIHETVRVAFQGEGSMSVNGVLSPIGATWPISVDGECTIVFILTCFDKTPALFVSGTSVKTGQSWEVSLDDRHWLPAGFGPFNDESTPPIDFPFQRKEIMPAIVEAVKGGILADFGRETFGYLKFDTIGPAERVHVFYGESREEALDNSFVGHTHTDTIELAGQSSASVAVPKSRAFRFVHVRIEPLEGAVAAISNVSADYEYLGLARRGKFRCSEQALNRIWDVAAYTMELTTREFFLDGIKRDRWVWSGDAVQSFLMNYYFYFDRAVNRRTLIALRGQDPVAHHINCIPDYSFYWFIGLYDHYRHTGDLSLVSQVYEKAVSLMRFCLSRRNDNGMIEGRPDDWVFIDWADMEKDGEVSVEQLLFCRSLECLAELSSALGKPADAEEFRAIATSLRGDLLCAFWDESIGVLMHSRSDGVMRERITKYPNIFAVLYGYLDSVKQESVRDKVLKGDAVQPITTPYMRFYELSALCELGEHETVIDYMRAYWGGMLAEGATTFWEEYDPALKGASHYSMYGDPFGKSLCHAWGASPIYLLGRYFLGVVPSEVGYGRFSAQPNRGGLEWIEGAVPMPSGDVAVYMDSGAIRISTTGASGTLRFSSKQPPVISHGYLTHLGADDYELEIDAGRDYEIRYW